jgi:hypothetical protein
MVGNSAPNPAILTAKMTTLDGATDLDTVWVSVPAVNAGSIACIALTGYIDLGASDNSDIIDIRCRAESGFAAFGVLFAVPVDQLLTQSALTQLESESPGD